MEQAAHGGDATTTDIRSGDLLDRIANDDRLAFEQFYSHFAARVFGLAVKVLIDRGQAEEVTQEVFLQIWQQMNRFDPARGSAIAWVLHITHARAVDRVRSSHASSVRDSRYAAGQLVRDVDSVVETALLREQQVAVRVALLRLTALQRESIVLAYFSGLTTLEISERLGVGRSTVKTRIRDGLIKLGSEFQAAAAEGTP